MTPPFPHAGEIAGLATSCCWVVTALSFEAAGRRIGSLVVNLVRLVLAMGFLALFNGLTRGAWLPLDASAHAWLWLSASGVVGFALGDLCLFRAFVVLGARVSTLLMALVPALTAVFGWVALRETLTLLQLAGMALVMAGVAWVVLERVPAGDGTRRRPSATGIALGLGGALGQAGGLVLSKVGMTDVDPFSATQIRVIAGAATFALIFTVIGWWPRTIAALRDRRAMSLTGLGAFFGPFLGVSLSLTAVLYTAAGVAATLMSLLPVLIIPPAILLNGERVSPRALGGALLAVGGSALLFL